MRKGSSPGEDSRARTELSWWNPPMGKEVASCLCRPSFHSLCGPYWAHQQNPSQNHPFADWLLDAKASVGNLCSQTFISPTALQGRFYYTYFASEDWREYMRWHYKATPESSSLSASPLCGHPFPVFIDLLFMEVLFACSKTITPKCIAQYIFTCVCICVTTTLSKTEQILPSVKSPFYECLLKVTSVLISVSIDWFFLL